MRYMKHFVTDKSPRTKILRWIVMSVMISAILLTLSLPALAQTKYVITDGDNVIVCMSNSSDPAVVIEEAGLQLGESDTYTTQTTDGIAEIHINRVQMVTVREGNETIVVGTYGGTAADVLRSLEITLAASDRLSCSPDTQTYDGMTITVTRVKEEFLEYQEVVPYQTRIYEDGSLEPGKEIVLAAGVDGVTRYRARIVYENGVEILRDVLSEQVISEASDAVILRGVDRSVKAQNLSASEAPQQPEPSQLTEVVHDPAGTSNLPEMIQGAYVPGTNLPYSELLHFEATAYYCEPYERGITFTGTKARVGTVAVDPNVIPLGTKMYIVTADGEYVYGYCVAEDTGGVIKGKLVDLYFNTYDECIQFGRRDILIYILE